MGSFDNKKQLRFVITLGTGKFGSSNQNKITLQGYRASVDIDKAGGMMLGTLRARVYGVNQNDMNAITTLQWGPLRLIPNTVEVYAIDGPAETLVFAGNIVQAWGDYQSMPDVFLHIQAQSAFFGQIKAVPPRSFQGAVDVASVMGQIARDLGYSFENNGVEITLTDLYLANTGVEQARELAYAAGCDIYIDDKIIAITPANVPRGSLMPLISAQTGMVGYPSFDGVGVNLQTLFNPGIIFGGRIKVESPITRAAGEWVVAAMAHRLESEKPGGSWFSAIRANQIGLAL